MRQLKYFTAVVETGSFTEAAEQCHISQSAVSQQIQALERELGVELLHRENRSFMLTAAGEHFYRKGRSLLDELDRLYRETSEIAQKYEPKNFLNPLRCNSFRSACYRKHKAKDFFILSPRKPLS